MIVSAYFGIAPALPLNAVRFTPSTGAHKGRGVSDGEMFLWGHSNVDIIDFIPQNGLVTIDGADIIQTSEWTLSEHVDAGGVVYEITLSRDPECVYVGLDTYMMWCDGAWLVRKTSVADCAANPGSFYVPQPNMMDVPSLAYVHATDSTDPRIDGKLYEYSKRGGCIELAAQNDAMVRCCHVTRGGSAYGCIPCGLRVDMRNVLISRGGKHNTVCGSGVLQDCIAYDAEIGRSVLADSGCIPYTFYRVDPTGLSWELQRCLGIMPPGRKLAGGFVYAHSSGELYYSNATIDGFLSNSGIIGGLGAVSGVGKINNSCALAARPSALSIPRSATYEMKNNAIQATSPNGWGGIIVGTSSPISTSDGEIANNAIYQSSITSAGWALGVEITSPLGFDFHHNTLILLGTDLHAAFYATSALSESQFKNNIVLVDHGSRKFCHIKHDIYCDYNVYIQLGSNAFWYDSTTGAASSLSEWRSESGHDTNSVLLNETQANQLFLNGVSGLANGDFRLNPEYNGTFVDGTPIIMAGQQSYMDYSSRLVKEGQVESWPILPATEEDCIEYVLNPSGWMFYA